MHRLIAAVVIVCAGCTATPPAADRWLGEWRGPEGTYLRIERGNANYTITISNLDGPRQFVADAVTDGLRFERDGAVETIRASNGEGTGMKWLRDKTNCLTVKVGEGFCRD